ncbi:hypothetical protein OEZ66_11735, partial [Escherichia coli]|nr:hypothetical protein [Escherichia coli]
IIQGERVAFDERGVKMPEYAKRHGETDMQQALSGQDKFDTLSQALHGDKQAADALAGANTTLAVNQNDATNLQENGLITQTQAEAIPENGVGTVHMSMRDTPDGQAAATATVQTGNSTVSDNSFTSNSDQTFGAAASAQQNLQHAPAIERFIAASERTNTGSSSRLLGAEMAKSLSPFITQSGDGRTQQAIDGGASIGRSGFLREVGKALGVNLSAGVNMSNINGHSTATDQIAAAAGHKIQQFRDSATEQADAAHLSGNAREQFINQNVALQSEAFYKPLLKAAQDTAEARSTGSIVSDISTPQAAQPAAAQPDQGFTREGISSPQEYAARMRQNAEDSTSTAQPSQAEATPQYKESQTAPAPYQPGLSGSSQSEHSQATESHVDNHVTAQPSQAEAAPQYQEQQQTPVPYQPGLSGSSRNEHSQANESHDDNHDNSGSNSIHPPVSGSHSETGIPVQQNSGVSNKNIPG